MIHLLHEVNGLKNVFALGGVTSKYRAQLIIDAYREWLKPGMKILDVGCGNGVVGQYIQEVLNLKLVGCDIVNRLEAPIRFKKMVSAHRLPFSDKSFDAAILNDCLHHCDKQTQEILLKEAKRVAKRVLVFEYTPTILGEFADCAVNIFHYKTLELSFPLHPRSKEQWALLFKRLKMKHSLKVIKRPWFYPFSHIAFILSSA